MNGLAQLGGPIAGVALALVLVAPARRERLAGLGFAAFGAGVLAASLVPHHRLLVLFGAVLLALAIALGLATAFRSYPWLLPVLALGAVPARVGIHLGDSSAKLLVPLYLVIAGGVVLLVWDLLAGDARARELRALSWPLAACVAWTGLSLLWTRDVVEGATEMLAFYVPFTLLAVCVARLPWQALGLRALLALVVAMGLAVSLVGFYQYATRDVFQNPKVITANAYAPFFRVNSVFWDPSVYGRFLVVAMLPVVVLLARGRLGRWSPLSVLVLAVLWLGLLISFSQSSFAALLVVVAAALFLCWRWRALLAIAAAAAVLAGIAVAQPEIRQRLQRHTVDGLNEATSGRASLVAQGIRIAEANPALGVGIGGFKRAYAKRAGFTGKDPRKAASHNTPVTVAAETGLPGLALFAWLLYATFRCAFRRPSSVSLVGGIGVAAIACHSLFYNAFFEDPLTWGLLALVALVAPASVPRRAPAVAEAQREAVAA